MKSIARFVLLLLFVCGTTLAWKTSDRRFRNFSAASEEGRQKEEGDEILQAVLQPIHNVRPGSGMAPAWSRADFQAQLEEAFQKNDPCAVLELLRSPQDSSPRELWSSGMAVLLAHHKEQMPTLEELLASGESPLYGLPKEGARRLETRFFNALVYSGQLRGLDEESSSARRKGARNFEKAIEILRELIAEDPDNGAYAYFLASALRQSGAKKEEVRSAMGLAVKMARFDPFYQSIYDSLQSIAYANSATFAWVHSFLESMPAPDFDIGIRYLKYWAHEEEPGKWIAHRLAKRLVDLGARYKENSPGYQFSRSEYLLGQNLKYTVEGRMEKSWEDYMNKMREAQDFISESPRSVVDAEVQLYRERIESKRSCAPDAWKALYSAYRAKKT